MQLDHTWQDGKGMVYRSTLLSGIASALQLSTAVDGGNASAVPLKLLMLE